MPIFAIHLSLDNVQSWKLLLLVNFFKSSESIVFTEGGKYFR